MEFDIAGELAVRLGYDFLHLQVHVGRTVLPFLDGDYPAMDQPLTAAHTLAEGRHWPGSPWLAAAHILEAFRRLQLLEQERVLLSLAAAARAPAALLPPGLALVLHGVEAAAHAVEGDTTAAAIALRKARWKIDADAVPRVVVALTAVLEHHLAVRAGFAHAGLRDLVAWADDRLNGTAQRALMQARYLAATPGCLNAARRLLEPVADGGATAVLPSTRVDVELVRAALGIRTGDRMVARGAVERALGDAAEAELLRPFAQADPRVRELMGSSWAASAGTTTSPAGFSSRRRRARRSASVLT